MRSFTPGEMAAVCIAASNQEGRMHTFETFDGRVRVISGESLGNVELGQEGLTRLIINRIIKYGGNCSYLLTRTGWEAINKQPPENLIL